MTRAIVCAAAALAASLVHAQPEPAFEVASVKRHDMPNGFVRRPWSPNIQCPPFHCGISGNRFTEEVASLADLIMDAYHVRRYQISGLPDWGDTGIDVYDIAATLPAGETPTIERTRRMLQTLLADRFHLKIHHDTKELPAYALVPGKGGITLKKSEKPCEKLPGGGGRGLANDPAGPFLTSWERVPEILGMFAERPVIDKTGLEGHYCTADGQEAMFSLDMRGVAGGGGGGRGGGGAGGGAPAGRPGTTIFAEVQRKWGMKLEAQKGPVDVVVIDHVERPSAN